MAATEAVEKYEGPVCYNADDPGWHYTAVPNPAGLGNGDEGHVYEVPGVRLFLDDSDPENPFYRLAKEGDESWHDRKHRGYASLVVEGGAITKDIDMETYKQFEEFLKGRGLPT